MNIYECLILSYTNDVLRDERLNVGVVVFDKTTREMHTRLIETPSRLNLVFKEFDDSSLLNLKHSVDELLNDIKRFLSEGRTFTQASVGVKHLYPWLAPRDTIVGLYADIQAVVDECYQRYVE